MKRQFIISETQVVAFTAIVEADSEDEAREAFLDGSAVILQSSSDVQDSYGLTVKIEGHRA